jgi:hypothetical protein
VSLVEDALISSFCAIYMSRSSANIDSDKVVPRIATHCGKWDYGWVMDKAVVRYRWRYGSRREA